jgi:Spy/CpxP family protein refolding chaperone
MNAKYLQLAGSFLLLLAGPSVFAQTTNTNALPLTQTLKYQIALESDRSMGELSLLPPGLKEKLRLTDAQRSGFREIEEEFAVTSQEYEVANRPRIEAAQEAGRTARVSKNPEAIQAARKQLQNVWAGVQPYRVASVKQIKPLLTPEQLVILEDPANQWRESHLSEPHDPSSN